MKALAHKASAAMEPCGRGLRQAWKAHSAPWVIRLAAIIMLTWAHVHMGTCAFGQSTGTVRIVCETPGCAYVLDGRNRMSEREVTLMEGAHRFTFWAPERRMLDTTYLVLANATRELRVQLRYSAEYIDYRHAADRHRRNQRWVRYGPPVAMVGAAAWTAVSIKRLIDARKDLDALEQEYYDSSYPGGLRALKESRIPAANQELRQARTLAVVSSGVLAATAAGASYLRRRFARKGAPVFDDKEKLRFDGLSWMPAEQGPGLWLATLSLPLR